MHLLLLPPSSDSAEDTEAAAEDSAPTPTRRATRGAATRATAVPGVAAARVGRKKVL